MLNRAGFALTPGHHAGPPGRDPQPLGINVVCGPSASFGRRGHTSEGMHLAAPTEQTQSHRTILALAMPPRDPGLRLRSTQGASPGAPGSLPVRVSRPRPSPSVGSASFPAPAFPDTWMETGRSRGPCRHTPRTRVRVSPLQAKPASSWLRPWTWHRPGLRPPGTPRPPVSSAHWRRLWGAGKSSLSPSRPPITCPLSAPHSGRAEEVQVRQCGPLGPSQATSSPGKAQFSQGVSFLPLDRVTAHFGAPTCASPYRPGVPWG